MGRRPKDLTKLYDEAEENESCVVAFTQGDRQMLSRHALNDDLVCPVPHLYARRQTWKELDPNARTLWTMRGLQALHPGWVFHGTSAALAHGMRVSYSSAHTIGVLLPHKKKALDASGLHPMLRAPQAPVVTFKAMAPETLESLKTVDRDGLRVTDALRAAFDSLCEQDFSNGLVTADSYLAQSGITSSQLSEAFLGFGAPQEDLSHARMTAEYADRRSESGGESYARGRIIANGYEVPDLQVWFNDPVDGQPMRADFVWTQPSGKLLVGEFDGFGKYQDPSMTRGQPVERVLVKQNRRDTRINLCCEAIFHIGPEDTADDRRLRRILDCYGVPKRGQARG